MLQKFQPEERHLRHARHVARLSLGLFDGLRTRHRLNAPARDLLHFSALLHDVGAVVGYDRHAEHSAYVIRNGSLRGLSALEVEMIALIAQYHGKARPRNRDRAFRRLDRHQQRAVKWLSAILRIAEGLDRSHYQLVQDLRVLRTRKRVSLRLTVRRGAGLELWAARRRTRLLERLIGAKVTVSVKTAERGTSVGPHPERPARSRTAATTRGRSPRPAGGTSGRIQRAPTRGS